MKVTNKQKEEIKKLKGQGLSNVKIGLKLGLSQSVIGYHSSEEGRKKRIKREVKRFKNLPMKKKQEIYKTRKEYIKKYMKNRYKTDEKFRERIKEQSRDYQKNSNRDVRRLEK